MAEKGTSLSSVADWNKWGIVGCKSLSRWKEEEASIREKIETTIFACNVFLLGVILRALVPTSSDNKARPSFVIKGHPAFAELAGERWGGILFFLLVGPWAANHVGTSLNICASLQHREHAQVHVKSTLISGYWLTENRCSNYLVLILGPKTPHCAWGSIAC